MNFRGRRRDSVQVQERREGRLSPAPVSHPSFTLLVSLFPPVPPSLKFHREKGHSKMFARPLFILGALAAYVAADLEILVPGGENLWWGASPVHLSPIYSRLAVCNQSYPLPFYSRKLGKQHHLELQGLSVPELHYPVNTQFCSPNISRQMLTLHTG